MSEKNILKSLLTSNLSSIDNAIRNLTDEPTASIGTTLSDIWEILFGGISYLAEKKRLKWAYDLELFRQELEESISTIPPEKQIEPSLQITAQALENSKYCIEEAELRHMFTSLICKSINSDYSKLAHPSFAEILKQMSVLDAKIISLFKDKTGKFIRLPICKYSFHILNSLSHIDLPDHIFLELPTVDFRLCSQSLSSLSRFGLLTIAYDKKLDTPNLYDKFLDFPAYKFAKANYPFANVKMIEGIVEPTPLGQSFVEVCVPD